MSAKFRPLGPRGSVEIAAYGEDPSLLRGGDRGDLGLDDPLDVQAEALRIREVLADVALWVDDHGAARALVTHQVGGYLPAVVREVNQDRLGRAALA